MDSFLLFFYIFFFFVDTFGPKIIIQIWNILWNIISFVVLRALFYSLIFVINSN